MNRIGPKQWHTLQPKDVIAELRTDPRQGLVEEEIQDRRKLYGKNQISQRKRQSSLARLIQQFNQPLIYILLVAALLTLVLGEWVDAGVIVAVVAINAVVGFVQESKAVTAIDSLARSLQAMATVIRAGVRKVISSEDLVPGDIVLLQAGDRVPADLRLISVTDLQVDESALTGESLPVTKSMKADLEAVELAERKGMAYAASVITFGQGTGVVVATGDGTEMGQISDLVATADILQTPLTRKIAEFSHLLLWVILGLAALIAIGGLLRGQELVEVLMAAIALIVSAVPEGLPAAITIMMAIGVSKMARRKAIVRKLPAIETLGSTNIICSDKTGTLTQNQMTVQKIFCDSSTFEVSGVGYDPRGHISLGGEPVEAKSTPLVECLRAGVLCNDSWIEQDSAGLWKVVGDPTEGALLVAGGKAGVVPHRENQIRPRLNEIPFQSEYQYMATLHSDSSTGQYVVYIKGSVEAISARCSRILVESGERSFLASEIESVVECLGSSGLRVLAFARLQLPEAVDRIDHSLLQGGLTFLGLQAMIDPPRAEARDAISLCQRAGIQVKMITGDHALTAVRIAEQLNIPVRKSDGSACALTGRQIAEFSDHDLREAAAETNVFARVSPEQKLKLVRALQSLGHVVAMTGDGVNDAPALRQADIGVAMGLKGTDAAREAADMVLADDNFASIESAVEEGRNVFDNLTKFIVWTLPTNLGESLILLAAVLLGFTLPVEPIQILWINMTTAGLLGITLAFEPKEPFVMDRPPRRRDQPILTRDLLMRTLFVGAFILVAAFAILQWELSRGSSLEVARSSVVTAVIAIETFYLFNCRSLLMPISALGYFTNLWVWLGAFAMLGLQLLFVYLPLMHGLFNSRPLDLKSWGFVLASGFTLFVLVNIEKRLRLYVRKKAPSR